MKKVTVYVSRFHFFWQLCKSQSGTKSHSPENKAYKVVKRDTEVIIKTLSSENHASTSLSEKPM